MSTVLAHARQALAGRPAWLVGGALRDRLMDRATEDLDVVVDGDPAAAARAVGRAARAAVFALSDAHGAWRVVDRDQRWQLDVTPMRKGSIEADLLLRDFTVNALAEPLAGGEVVDPSGGLEDLRARRLRMVATEVFTQDPLRTLRLARLACQLELDPERATVDRARSDAPAIGEVAAERVFAELTQILASERVNRGLNLMDAIGLTELILPELSALRGVAQNRFHHLDVHDHSRAVLDAVVALESDPEPVIGSKLTPAVSALLDEPLADGCTRGTALRLGALLHDAAKPATRTVTETGRVIFPGHDLAGAQLAGDVLGRLRASERLRSHVAALTRHHLRLGFLVHHEPLDRRQTYRYLHACAPVAADVTLLSVADRLATRGDDAGRAIERHLALAIEMLDEALRWRREGAPSAPVRGDELADALTIARGPQIGALLDALAEARFVDGVTTREQAIEHARRLSDAQ